MENAKVHQLHRSKGDESAADKIAKASTMMKNYRENECNISPWMKRGRFTGGYSHKKVERDISSAHRDGKNLLSKGEVERKM